MFEMIIHYTEAASVGTACAVSYVNEYIPTCNLVGMVYTTHLKDMLGVIAKRSKCQPHDSEM